MHYFMEAFKKVDIIVTPTTGYYSLVAVELPMFILS